MKVPYSWLKSFVDFDLSPEALAERLVKSGFEVEGIEKTCGQINKVLVCKITKIERHPDADRLQVCHITYGDRESVIITAATNVFEGAVVPAATDGSTLYDGTRINASPLRGIMSNGMFCGGDELGVDDTVIAGASVNGILILPPDTPLGADIRDVLGLNEIVLDISVTSNRPDCQSIIGIARETAAILELPFKEPNLTYKVTEENTADYLSVEVTATDLCPSYYGAVVRDITVQESPKWMRDRLRAVGIRSINNIVDITNYVLTEIGQPMHAFDLRDVRGGKITVRRALDGEKITTLDEKEFALTPDNLVIADTEGAIALAGIMGGLNSEVKPDTKNIAFEAARFARGNVRQTARKLGQRSASSARFERGIDLGTTLTGMERALALIDELGCGRICKGKAFAEASSAERRVLTVPMQRINALLGITVPTDEAVRILNSLSIVTTAKDDVLTCTIPLEREDLENHADLAEEIIRIYGYEHIVPTLPDVDGGAIKSFESVATQRTKNTLVGLGCCEAATYSFVQPDVFDKLGLDANDPRRTAIRIANPISEDMSVMRTTMAHNMITAAALNQNRKNTDFRLFEISRVFRPVALPLTERPVEETHLALCVCGEKESFFTLKGILNEIASDFGIKFGFFESKEVFLHPGISADVQMKGKVIGYIGCVHPTVAERYDLTSRVYIAELNFDAMLAVAPKQVKFAPLPKYQEIERDIALTVKDEVKAGDMLRSISRDGGAKLESVTVFDVYKGKQIEAGYKSIAFKLVFRAPDRTLTDDEVAVIMAKIQESLAKKFDAKLR